MRNYRALFLASAFLLAPLGATVSFAQNSGSNTPPATDRAAVPGAISNGALGTTTGDSTKPTSGTAGGGLATANGTKAGGAGKVHRHKGKGHKKHNAMTPAQ